MPNKRLNMIHISISTFPFVVSHIKIVFVYSIVIKSNLQLLSGVATAYTIC